MAENAEVRISIQAPAIGPLFKLLNSQICAPYTEFCMTIAEKAHIRLRDESQFFEMVLSGKRSGLDKFSVGFSRESMLHQLTTVLKFIRASGNGGISTVDLILQDNGLLISCNDKSHNTISNFKARVSGHTCAAMPHIAPALNINANININNTSIRCLVESDDFDAFQISVNRLSGRNCILEVIMRVTDSDYVSQKEFRVVAYDDGRDNLPSDIEIEDIERLIAEDKMQTEKIMQYNYVGSKVRDFSTSIAQLSVLNLLIAEKGLLILKYELENMVNIKNCTFNNNDNL